MRVPLRVDLSGLETEIFYAEREADSPLTGATSMKVVIGCNSNFRPTLERYAGCGQLTPTSLCENVNILLHDCGKTAA